MSTLGMFIGALIAVYLVPGPDMVLVLQTSSTQGRLHALATAVGLGFARAAHVTLAAIGLATLLKTEPWAFNVVRTVGAMYLVWLGIKIARASSLTPEISVATSDSSVSPYRAAVWRGLLTNITNPKALLFCSVLLPQFIDADTGHIASQFLLLGLIVVVIGFLFDVLYAMMGAALGYWMRRNSMVQTVQRWTFAALLIGFGARLAVASHSQ
jgi:threonine/homoserine/homoserine lactone efflux protein